MTALGEGVEGVLMAVGAGRGADEARGSEADPILPGRATRTGETLRAGGAGRALQPLGALGAGGAGTPARRAITLCEWQTRVVMRRITGSCQRSESSKAASVRS